MSRIVVDASIATMWFASEPASAAAARLLEGDDELLVPDLLYVETANALWKKQARGEIAAEAVEESLSSLIALDLIVTPAKTLVTAASQLAVQARHPVYDCIYVVLSRRRGALLATADKRLAGLSATQGVELWDLAAGNR